MEYRIENKNNVNMSGHKTAFHIFEEIEESNSFIHIGRGYAKGNNASDEKCIDAFFSDNENW